MISNIAASHGSIAVVPDELDGCVVSSEYTVLVPLPGYDPVILQLIIRSPEIRSDILLSASGANRTRARWEAIRNIQIPYPDEETIKMVRQYWDDAERAKRSAMIATENAKDHAETALLLRSDTAATILSAFKPPK